MAKSLLEQLPEIVKSGKRQAQQILEQLEGPQRVSLQTRELVIPNRAASGLDLYGHLDGTFDTTNRLIYGDNLLAMAALLAGDEVAGVSSLRGKVDLIYIDPPFDSKADYRTKLQLPGTDVEQRPTTAEQFAYSDTWADGTASYLAMITPRLVLMREMLADTGTLILHIDWHVGHYVKLVLDEIFGRAKFLNEIVWYYSTLGRPTNRFAQKHDDLFVYARGDAPYFNEADARVPYSAEYIRTHFRDIDDNGRPCRKRFDAGKWRTYYPEDGMIPNDVWEIPYENSMSRDRLNYATQKPTALLERIVSSYTSEGMLVADFFVGSGTTAAVAERLNRRWIATDLGKPAVMITRKRLIDGGAQPFLYQAIGDYQVEQARSSLGRRYRTGELAQTVLGIYGALPLPVDQNLGGVLGHLPGESTLVYADSPARQVTVSTLKRAQQLRETAMGGFERVIVLGWNFTAGIGHEIAGLDDPSLEVRVIPPDLLDQLKKKGESGLAGKITFSTLQYLRARVAGPFPVDDSETINVDLTDYVLLSPDAISIRPEDRAAIRELSNREPLALIEYWAVDPDYDGEVFRSVWQNYRGNVLDDGDPLRVGVSASITVSAKSEPRTICVRAVDVFGFESEDILTLEAGTR